MEFQKSIIKIIRERKSCRSYDTKEIDKLTLQKLHDYIDEANAEMKIKARFTFAQKQEKIIETSEKLGTYGMISGASSFIIGIIDKDKKDTLEFGYLFEKLILFATDLGLGTCWLGGTFNRNDFEHKTRLLENEFIPIVSPVGIKKEKPRIFESAVRAVVGANKRKLWSQLFFEDNIENPLNEESAGAYTLPLEMVRLAPSASNKQPCRIIKDKNGFNFFLCRTKAYPSSSFDMQKNDLGIAMCHFELTAKELGLNGGFIEKQKVAIPNEWEYIITWI